MLLIQVFYAILNSIIQEVFSRLFITFFYSAGDFTLLTSTLSTATAAFKKSNISFRELVKYNPIKGSPFSPLDVVINNDPHFLNKKQLTEALQSRNILHLIGKGYSGADESLKSKFSLATDQVFNENISPVKPSELSPKSQKGALIEPLFWCGIDSQGPCGLLQASAVIGEVFDPLAESSIFKVDLNVATLLVSADRRNQSIGRSLIRNLISSLLSRIKIALEHTEALITNVILEVRVDSNVGASLLVKDLINVEFLEQLDCTASSSAGQLVLFANLTPHSDITIYPNGSPLQLRLN